MPHIYSSGCDMDKNIQYINIHAEIQFKQEYFNNVKKRQEKLEELQADIEKLLEKYFGMNVNESEIMSNHDHNLIKSASY